MGKGEGKGHAAAQEEEDVWFIHGQPYDLGKEDWLEKHPGGKYILEITKGTDCTALFESYHAASLKEKFIASKLSRHKLAALRSDEPTVSTPRYAWDSTPLYNDVKAVVREYRKKHGVKATDMPAALAWYAAWGAIHYTSLGRWLWGDNSLANLVLLGMSVWFFCGDLMHNGTHYALTYGSAAGERIAWICGFLFIIPAAWVRQHVVGHHVHTNAHEHDPDLYHFERFFKVQTKGMEIDDPVNAYLLAPIAPLFTHMSPSLRGTWELLTKKRWTGVKETVVWAKGEEALTWATWVVLTAGFFYMGWCHGARHVLVPSITTAAFYYLFSQVSHINAASFETPKTKEWACMQITTTQGDYGYDSWFWNKMSNGLHNQTLHHLIPSVHSSHYPALSKLLEPVFVKHGMPMPGWNNGYAKSFRLHVQHLSTLNKWQAIAAICDLD